MRTKEFVPIVFLALLTLLISAVIFHINSIGNVESVSSPPVVVPSAPTPTPKPTCPESPGAFNGATRAELIRLAVSKGASATDINDIAYSYDMICFGESELTPTNK